MSAETRPSSMNPEMSGLHPKTIEEINSIPTPEDSRETSPFATNVAEAANRIADFMETRAVNSAHSEALKEYRNRDHSDYVDHLAKLSEAQVEDDVITTEKQQTYAQDALNRENRIEDRAEAIDQAKSKLKGFGRSALKFLRGAGKIGAAVGITTLGAGLVAGEAAGRGIAKGAKTAGEGIAKGSDAIVAYTDDKYNGARLRVGRTVENSVQSVKNRAELAAFDLNQLRKEYSFANAKQNIRDKAELFKGGVDELSLAVTEYRLVQTKRAKLAIARKIARAKEFGGRQVERFNDARETAKRRAKRIGHRAVTTLSVARESGQMFVDNMKSLKDEESTYTK